MQGNPQQPDEVANVSVAMFNPDITLAPHVTLPDGYTFRPFGEGDLATWLSVQQRSETFFVPNESHFFRYMPGHPELWSQRILFLVDPSGGDVGTITAWDDASLMGYPMGLIHWVALIPEVRGRGLAKPMLSAALNRLQQLGFSQAWLESGTARIPALNLYLQFGFQPYVRNEDERAAWRAAAPSLKYTISV